MAIWLALCQLGLASGIFFTLEPKVERCVGLWVETSQEFYGTYVFTGTHERNVIAQVKSPLGYIIYQSRRGVRDGKFSLNTTDAGVHKLCFQTTDYVKKMVSFDLRREEKQENSKNDEDWLPLAEKLQEMSRGYDAVYNNIHFYQIRERTHRALADATCDLVLWCVLVKLAVLICVSCVQVRILQSLLAVKSVV